MEKLSELFRGKEKRKVVHVLAEAVYNALTVQVNNGGRGKTTITEPYLEARYHVSLAKRQEGDEWYLWKNNHIVLSVEGDIRLATEVLTCAILCFYGEDSY